jgi:hypothetical protein
MKIFGFFRLLNRYWNSAVLENTGSISLSVKTEALADLFEESEGILALANAPND